MAYLKRQYKVLAVFAVVLAVLLSLAAAALAITVVMEISPNMFFVMICSVVAGMAIGKLSEIYTSDQYLYVKNIAAACETGAATNIVTGFSTGMLSGSRNKFSKQKELR